MNKYYVVPTNSLDFFVEGDSFFSMLERISPELYERLKDNNLDSIQRNDEEISMMYEDAHIPSELVLISDGDVLYEAETTKIVDCIDDNTLKEYEADSMEVLELFVFNENYSDFAGNFFKKGKSGKMDDKTKNLSSFNY